MRKWLIILFVISLLPALCGCVAEVRTEGYHGHREYYHEYPRYRYYYYDYDYPYGGSLYYRFRAR